MNNRLEIPISEYTKGHPSAMTIKSDGGDYFEADPNDDNGSFKQYGKSLLNSINYDDLSKDEMK